MITIVPILIGGLGNRLYQIANAFRLQDLYGSNLKFYKINAKHTDIPKYRHLVIRQSDFDDFGGHDLVIKEDLPKSISEVFPTLDFESTPTYIDDILINKQLIFEGNIESINPNIDNVVMGYFFPYSFIKNYVGKVKSSFNPNIQKYIDNKYIDLKNKKVLGIHLRLGINTDNNPAIVVPDSFYTNVLNLEKNNFDLIYIISDNIEKSKSFMSKIDTFGNSVVYIEGEPMFVDLLILSNCTSLIIAPSTLSAWSAYLNDHKNIYVPKIWTNHHWTNDIPSEWKLL